MTNSLKIDFPKANKNKEKIVLFYPHFGERQQDSHWFPFPYLYLAPFLEKAGYVVKIIDARVDLDWKNTLTKELKDSFALGVTSMSGQDLIPAMEASEIAKGMNNKINSNKIIPMQINYNVIGKNCNLLHEFKSVDIIFKF